MRHTFEVKYNDFGVCHVVADSYSAAEKLFLESGYGGGEKEAELKSIIKLVSYHEPLVSEPN